MSAREAMRIARELYLAAEGSADELTAYVLYAATASGLAAIERKATTDDTEGMVLQ